MIANLPELVLPLLMRTTVTTFTVGILAYLLLRALRLQSPFATRVVSVAVLLQGWLVWQIDVPVSFAAAALPSTNDPQILHADSMVSPPRWETGGRFRTSPTNLNSRPLEGSRSEGRRQSVAAGIVTMWMTGVIALLLWAIVGHALLCRRIARLEPVDAAVADQWAIILAQSGIHRPVRMLWASRSGPLLCRTLSETVLVIPADRWQGLTASQRSAVLHHEAAHLLRGDLWKSLVIRLLALPQWFNPAAWWAVRRFDDAAEWACDDLVPMTENHHGPDYARALVRLSTHGGPRQFVMSAAGGRGLAARIRRHLTPHLKEENRMKPVVCCGTFLVLIGVCALRPQAADPDQVIADVLVAAPADVTSDDAADGDGSADVIDEKTESLLQEPMIITVATALVDEASEQTGREAVVDMHYLFKHDPAFLNAKKQLQAEIAESEDELKEMTKRLQADQQQLQKLSVGEEPEAREALASAADELQSAIENRRQSLRRRFLREESEMYMKSYQRITEAIAEHARANDIRLVRRRNSVADDARTDDTGATVRPERSDSSAGLSPQDVIQLINRDIVYVADPPLDITQAVFERLKSNPLDDESAN